MHRFIDLLITILIAGCVGFTVGSLVPLDQYIPFHLDVLVVAGLYYFVYQKYLSFRRSSEDEE